MITDLTTALAHLKRQHPRPATLRVSRRALARIRRELRALTFIHPSPRPPPGDPDRWLWDTHQRLMDMAEVRLLGTLILPQK